MGLGTSALKNHCRRWGFHPTLWTEMSIPAKTLIFRRSYDFLEIKLFVKIYKSHNLVSCGALCWAPELKICVRIDLGEIYQNLGSKLQELQGKASKSPKYDFIKFRKNQNVTLKSVFWLEKTSQSIRLDETLIFDNDFSRRRCLTPLWGGGY